MQASNLGNQTAEAVNRTILVQVPIEAPSPDRLEAIYREEVAANIAKNDTWLTFKEAVNYLRISKRTLDRNRALWGLPFAELSDGIKRILRADLDALLKAHIVRPKGRPVTNFPSLQRHGLSNAELPIKAPPAPQT